jgi:DNA-3-methyladenine glycosylase
LTELSLAALRLSFKARPLHPQMLRATSGVKPPHSKVRLFRGVRRPDACWNRAELSRTLFCFASPRYSNSKYRNSAQTQNTNPMSPAPLPRSFYARDPVAVARSLLGRLLLRRTAEGVSGGRIVETEAYLAAHDPACHAARGRTRKNASMFGPPGHAYVYPIHARYCFNVVTEPEDVASAVLIRAVEPLTGVAAMQLRRRREPLRDLASGPAKLCEALAIDRHLDGWDLTLGRQLWIADDAGPPVFRIAQSPRIGVTSAQDLPLRFFVAGSRFVSGRRHD